jgi:rhodanese-related sulfurtransferase
LIGESPDQIADAKRELVRIGVDRLTGAATGDIDELRDGGEVGSYPVSDFAGLAIHLNDDMVTVLDVRQSHEYDDSHIREAVNIPLHELPIRVGEVPEGTLWVHCASGYRSSIAASFLDRTGRDVVLIDDDFDNAGQLPLSSRAAPR